MNLWNNIHGFNNLRSRGIGSDSGGGSGIGSGSGSVIGSVIGSGIGNKCFPKRCRVLAGSLFSPLGALSLCVATCTDGT